MHMSDKRVSINSAPATAVDVARLAGVSQSAVSRAFTPGASISAEKKTRIVEAARQIGYRPNVIARSLITGRSNTIGLVAAYLQNYFYPQIIEQMAARLRRSGFHIALFTTDLNQPADNILEEILGYGLDGLILVSTTLSSALADECRATGIPVVLFNRTTESLNVSSVTGENRRGGELMARFLVAAGHRKIAFMAGVEDSSTSRDREHGFVAGLAAHGLALCARVVGDYRYDRAGEAARSLLSSRERPDAIFCANDHMALAAIEVAKYEFGLTLARDISIVGFDDIELAGWPSFALTSFSQPAAPMVERTVDLILELIADDTAPTRHEIVAGDLVIRGSARLPPGCRTVEGRQTWEP